MRMHKLFKVIVKVATYVLAFGVGYVWNDFERGYFCADDFSKEDDCCDAGSGIHDVDDEKMFAE